MLWCKLQAQQQRLASYRVSQHPVLATKKSHKSVLKLVISGMTWHPQQSPAAAACQSQVESASCIAEIVRNPNVQAVDKEQQQQGNSNAVVQASCSTLFLVTNSELAGQHM
jgi:hypothetical protein